MRLEFALLGAPRTKKNSQRIVTNGRRRIVIPSEAYEQYRENCLWQIPTLARLNLNRPVNLCCLYYMPTRRQVDLVNLLEATCDILRDGGVIADDNSRIVVSHDGSRVLYDKERPRVEIEICEVDDYAR